MQDQPLASCSKNALDCGVASSVVRALWKFDECDDVQVVALHCVVFLARPIGGAEGKEARHATPRGFSEAIAAAYACA